jgi:hypothetical protein
MDILLELMALGVLMLAMLGTVILLLIVVIDLKKLKNLK